MDSSATNQTYILGLQTSLDNHVPFYLYENFKYDIESDSYSGLDTNCLSKYYKAFIDLDILSTSSSNFVSNRSLTGSKAIAAVQHMNSDTSILENISNVFFGIRYYYFKYGNFTNLNFFGYSGIPVGSFSRC